MAEAALKPERDFSKEADKQIPEAEELAKVRDFRVAEKFSTNTAVAST